jgi:serine/threonine-protein kinase
MSLCLVFFLLVVIVVGLILLLRARRLSFKARFFGILLLVMVPFVLLGASEPGGPLDLLAVLFLTFVIFGFLALLVILIARFSQRPDGAAALGQTSCPPVGRLKDLLGERLAPGEHARLAAHLEVCTACQHRVEGLTAGHESWPGVARRLTHQPPPLEPALKQVMDSLKGKQEEATGAEYVYSADLPLGFLSPPDKPDQLGRLERYEVLAEIGRGGMGVVLKAFDPSLHRVVAIKVLAPQLATSGVARKRFLREAKAAAAVTHDHIVTIHAVDEANGLPYLVMQYVAGLSLQERIDKEGPLELAEILRIGMQTASGLAAAHGQGIVHRDVKPANILLEDGVQRVKITDFGLARAMDDASLTQSGFVAGSPLYMAPEQARGEALDHRADLFSLGSVLYTMCTGRPPFRAANTLAVLRRVCDDAPRPIRETNPEVPDWLAAVVEKLMAKNPADRYPSASEVVEVLGRHLAQIQNGAWVPPPAAAKADTAGLPTSVTICPSCGASLHVPEWMVGSTVHCGDCGKPFRAEGNSEEILVALPVPSPLGRRGRRANRKFAAWAWILGGGAALLFFLFVLRGGLSPHHSPPAQTMSSTLPAGNVARPLVPFWKGPLGRFPAEATLFGAVDLKAFGSLKLDDEWTQTVIRLASSPEFNNKLTPENLGRIRIDGVSLAYYEDPKHEQSRGMVQLEGLALDGRKRIIDFIREATAGKVLIEEDKGSTGGKPWSFFRVSSAELPFALGLFDDRRVFLARCMQSGSKPAQHMKGLEQLPGLALPREPRPVGSGGWPAGEGRSANLLSGYQPPWIRTALAEIPADACGLLLGEIPIEWRKVLREGLELRTCPRTFVLYMKRQGQGVAISLRLNLEKAGAELILSQDLEKWRRQGFGVLQARVPFLCEEPEVLALLGQTLKTMRWGAKPGSGCVRTRVQIPGPIVRALGKAMERASRPHKEE